MKKIFFAASLFAASVFNAYCQDEATTTTATGMKAAAGDVTGEFILSNNFDLGLNNSQLRFRYFFADDMAARIGLRIFRESERMEVEEDGTNNIGILRTRSSEVAINLGIEKHFSGTERLSPYVGADILLSFAGERQKGENVDLGGDYAADFSFERTGYDVAGEELAGTGIGLRLVGGADFYVARNVFLGGEFGLGFLLRNRADVQSTETTAGVSTEITNEEGRSMTIEPAVIGGLRIGFVF